MNKNLINVDFKRILLMACLAVGGLNNDSSFLHAQTKACCKLASQTVIEPRTKVADLNGLVIPTQFFKEKCNGGAVVSVETKNTQVATPPWAQVTKLSNKKRNNQYETNSNNPFDLYLRGNADVWSSERLGTMHTRITRCPFG